MNTINKILIDGTRCANSSRATCRLVDLPKMAEQAGKEALSSGEIVILCDFGGIVPNSYNYPADTDCGLVVAIPDEDTGTVDVVGWGDMMPANKATYSGAARTATGHDEARPLFDHRFNAESKEVARDWLIRYALKVLEEHNQGA